MKVEKEKVIKGLECLAQIRVPTASPCKDCGYSDRPNYAVCVKDIAHDALFLLKEQEAVPITQREIAHMIFWCCGSCGVPITSGDKFCRNCGKAVKWE